MKPNFRIHPNENPSLTIVRLYKYIRSISPSHKPQSHYMTKQQNTEAKRPKLRLVK